MNDREGSLSEKGWMKLRFQFSEKELAHLERLNPFDGRGRRLSNMDALNQSLPHGFLNTLAATGFSPTALRAVGFNKSPELNWSLPWHQDRVIAMADRIDDPSLTNWTQKDGTWHCEPSVDILKNMAFAYIAFDAVTPRSGGLELSEGTHNLGKVRQTNTEKVVDLHPNVAPTLARGECLLIFALTLHRSSRNETLSPRRALRIDIKKQNDGLRDDH